MVTQQRPMTSILLPEVHYLVVFYIQNMLNTRTVKLTFYPHGYATCPKKNQNKSNTKLKDKQKHFFSQIKYEIT